MDKDNWTEGNSRNASDVRVRAGLVSALVRSGASYDDAEDAVQEALIRAVVGGMLRGPDGCAAIARWLFTVARNCLASQWRARKRARRRELLREYGRQRATACFEDEFVRREDMTRLLRRLHPGDRRVLNLLAEGCPRAELGAALGTSLFAAQKRAQRARREAARLWRGGAR